MTRTHFTAAGALLLIAASVASAQSFQTYQVTGSVCPLPACLLSSDENDWTKLPVPTNFAFKFDVGGTGPEAVAYSGGPDLNSPFVEAIASPTDPIEAIYPVPNLEGFPGFNATLQSMEVSYFPANQSHILGKPEIVISMVLGGGTWMITLDLFFNPALQTTGTGSVDPLSSTITVLDVPHSTVFAIYQVGSGTASPVASAPPPPPPPPPTFAFQGFYAPVANPPMANVVKAGQAVPIKFSLGGNQGLNIFKAPYPVAQQVLCDGSAAVDTIQTVTAGSSSLTYDAASNTYTYVWKTDKSWAGTCQVFILGLSDGTTHMANFQLK
jgi:hypothetical protein